MKRKRNGFESKTEPLLSRKKFVLRIVYHAGFGVVLAGISLLIGVYGYHHLEQLEWIDALLNASMILGGMGPVDPVKTEAGKIFASCYALFSGVIFLVVVGLIVSPLIHRVLHKFHLDD